MKTRRWPRRVRRAIDQDAMDLFAREAGYTLGDSAVISSAAEMRHLDRCRRELERHDADLARLNTVAANALEYMLNRKQARGSVAAEPQEQTVPSRSHQGIDSGPRKSASTRRGR